MREKGFTVIELLVVIAVVLVFGSVVVSNLTGYGVNGSITNITSNTKCIDGYKFIKGGYDYPPQQMFDEDGNGIPCN